MQGLKPILLVEDDRIDIMTVQRAFRDLKIENHLEVLTHAEVVLEYLQKATTLPALILLDINMPRMNGLELLALLKADGQLKNIPVFILTTSNQIEDKRRAYELKAADYVVKPLEYVLFLELMQTIRDYWSKEE